MTLPDLAPTSPARETTRAASLLVRHELPLAFAIAALSAAWGFASQSYQVFRYWDSDEYYRMAEQFAAGEPITAAAPYAYRVLVPWLVGQCCHADIQRGFLLINLASALALSVLFAFWLRAFVSTAGVRLLMVAALALQWHAPARFVFYYPAYVDPLFLVLVVAALIAGERLLGRPAIADGLTYAGLVAIGTQARETMLLLPVCGLLAAVLDRRDTRFGRIRWYAGALAAGVVAHLVARIIVEPRPGYGVVATIAEQLTRKPIESVLLAWFIAFGPMIAVVAYDWRATLTFLRRRADLAALPVLSLALAYAGGTDTERLIFWAAPVVYLLVAQSIERQRMLLSSAAVSTVVVTGQVLSQRVLWPVPDPGSAVTAWSDAKHWGARLYAIANRMFVIDDFHWNLWSNFGSRQVHLIQLGFYLAVSALVVLLMRRRASSLQSPDR